MNKQTILRSALTAAFALGITGCAAVAAKPQPTVAPVISAPAASAPLTAPNTGSEGLPTGVAAYEGTLERIYQSVNPSVVHIDVVQTGTAPAPIQTPFGVMPGPQQPYAQHGSGSGFVWDSDGHIVTNNHVIANADTIRVTFSDGSSTTATVLGADPSSDLAVLKLDQKPKMTLEPLNIGDSRNVQVGQLAIAIGNPFGLDGTMTTGIISAVGRSLPANEGNGPSYTIPDILQTDASINPGNSGGVLVDDNGQLIGVTAAIESPVGTSAGIGFAIPSAIVQQVVPALLSSGHYDHPWLGLSGMTLTPELAQAMKLPADQHGALVGSIVSGGPAEKAGLHGSSQKTTIEGQEVPIGGDVITAIDGQQVKSFEDVAAYLARNAKVGQTVTLTVLRDGKEQQLSLTLAARPQETSQANVGNTPAVPTSAVWLGITALPLNADLAQAIGLSTTQNGVLIERVAQGSPADKAGLHGGDREVSVGGTNVLVGGDVIVAVDGQNVTTLEDIQAALAPDKAGQEITLGILRNGKSTDIKVTLENRPTN